MAKSRSFTEYVKNQLEDILWDNVESYIKQNDIKSLDLRSYRVYNIGDVELEDIEVRFVNAFDRPNSLIAFDVVVDATLVLYDADRYHNDETDEKHQWFILRCQGNLDCGLSDVMVKSTDLYVSKNRDKDAVSDSLVPIICKNQLEDVAYDFLKRNYPEALDKPMAIDPLILAENMGLTVQMRRITKDCTVFGQIFFQDSITEFYDEKTDSVIKTDVKAKTVFVDPQTFFLYNLGKVNNTIVHECVHWDKHKKSFELERLFNSDADKIKCRVEGGIEGNNKDATSWMEWQANALTPRIQMPLSMFKQQALKYIKKYQKELGKQDVIDVIEPVIDELAIFFCVSRIAAKIRMVDAGYDEAIGAFIYIDGKYVTTHRFKKGAIRENQTFSIGTIDAAIECATNPKLSDLVRDGSYQYVDSHFVLNHPKYLTEDENGFTVLTQYARNHMEECCIVFDMTVKSVGYKDYHSVCYLNKDKDSTISFEIKYGNGYENADPNKQKELLRSVILEENKIYRSLPNDLCMSLEKVFEWRNITYKELAEKINIDARTIGRILKGENREPSVQTLVLICLGLQLPPNISKHIINQASHSLNLSNETHAFYDFALTYLSKQSMESIFKFFQEHGINI
jgi:transcriptional regulator with XRE-family HTH domain